MAAYNKSEVVLAVAVAVLACMVAAEAAISCGAVSGKLAGCIPYLQGKVPKPPGNCCSGVNSLYSATKANRPDRVTACGCIKSASSGLNLDSGKVGGLPGQCGVNLGYSPSPSTNCASIP